jgi:hypothetical protein
MTRYEYDEDASARLHMDVVYEVEDEEPVPVSRWGRGDASAERH